jgi:TonB family protein
MRRKDWVGAGIGGVIAWFGGAAWAAEPPLFAGYPVTEGLVITAHLKDESPTVTSAQSRHGSTCYVLMWVRRSGFIQAVQVVKSTGFERLDAACIKGVVHQTLIPASDGTSPIDAWEILPIEWRGPTGVAPKASTYGPAIAVIAPNQTLNVDKVPASALALKDASCLVHVSVSASGSAEDLTVARSSGSDDLDRVCMDALRSLEFIPARNEGRNVAGIADVWIGWPASDVVTPTEIGSLPSVQFIGDRLTPGKDLIRALHAKADLLTLDPVARSSKHAQCMVSLWYAGDGTIHAAQLVVPSGLPVVDQACLQTVLGRKVVPPVGEQEFGGWGQLPITWSFDSARRDPVERPLPTDSIPVLTRRASLAPLPGPPAGSAEPSFEFCQVHVVVSDIGTVSRLDITHSTGSTRLDQACRTAVRDAPFQPATLKGLAVSGASDIAISRGLAPDQ